MTKDIRPVQEYIESRKKVSEFFKCEGDFFIRPLMDYNWSVKQGQDFSILSYWKEEVPKADSIIVKRSGEEMIFEAGNYTMVVGIDCVKIGFIFKNDNKTL